LILDEINAFRTRQSWINFVLDKVKWICKSAVLLSSFQKQTEEDTSQSVQLKCSTETMKINNLRINKSERHQLHFERRQNIKVVIFSLFCMWIKKNIILSTMTLQEINVSRAMQKIYVVFACWVNVLRINTNHIRLFCLKWKQRDDSIYFCQLIKIHIEKFIFMKKFIKCSNSKKHSSYLFVLHKMT
jgi:hypothetical protein